jgi:hypothetical protein
MMIEFSKINDSTGRSFRPIEVAAMCDPETGEFRPECGSVKFRGELTA